MKSFEVWAAENWSVVDVRSNAERIWEAAQVQAAKRCREIIAQQHFLATEPVVEIDKKIQKEFDLL